VYERHGSRARSFDNDDPRPARAAKRSTERPQLSFSFGSEG
jgi:hypothetical protein